MNKINMCTSKYHWIVVVVVITAILKERQEHHV